MTTALSPERLAPGDPEGARALAARLDANAEGAGAAGARLATVDLGRFAFKLSPTYARVDPEGYVEHAVGLGQGIASASPTRWSSPRR